MARRRGLAAACMLASASGPLFLAMVLVSWPWIIETWAIQELRFLKELPAWTAAAKLGGMGPRARMAAEEWYLEKLEGPDADAARQRLVDMNSLRALDILLGRVHSHPGELSQIEAIARARPAEASPAVLGLVLHDPDPFLYWSFLDLIRDLGFHAVDPLSRALGDPLEDVRYRAAHALEAIGAPAAPATPSLVRLLGDGSYDVRRQAAQTLGALAPESRPAVPALIERLEDDHVAVRKAALEAILGLDAEARSFLEALPARLEDPDEDIRLSAAKALLDGGGEPRRIARALGQLLKSDDGHVREEAAGALGSLGLLAREVLPQVIEALEAAREAGLRDSLVRVLRRMGPCAREALPALIGLLVRTRRNLVRGREEFGEASALHDSLIRAIARIKDEPDAATGILMHELRDERGFVRLHAARRLGERPAEAKAAIYALMDALEDGFPAVRVAAAEALGAMEKTALPALPELERARNDPEFFVREAAAKAVERILSRAGEAE